MTFLGIYSRCLRPIYSRSLLLYENRTLCVYSRTYSWFVTRRRLQCCRCTNKLQQHGLNSFLKRTKLGVRDISSFSERTHTCGTLTANHVGESVRLCGWLQYHRNSGLFLLLRDWTGIIQVITNEKMLENLEKITYEMVLEVEGTVQLRPDGQINKNMATGEIEVLATSLRILNTCRPQLPIDVSKEYVQSKESLRMEYRYLDIRGNKMQHNLRLRSKVIMKMREFLCNQHGFVDVETPTLFRKTPGGAKEFVVPSHHPGKFYSLPQSPQQFKQLLMVGGMDRYFQVAKCYRDEGSKPDRQPEFTQLDIEMSFTTQQHIQDLIEQLLKYCWPEEKGEITLPFPRMTYDEAMSEYGVDKPDTRFGMKLTDVSDILKGSGISKFEDCLQKDKGCCVAIKIPNGVNLLSNKETKELEESPLEELDVGVVHLKVNKDGSWKPFFKGLLQDATKQSLTERLDLEAADVAFIASGEGYDPHQVLGRLRCQVADRLDTKGMTVRDPDTHNFLWVTDFPLFLPKEDGPGLESAHHPFTAPHAEDEHLLYTTPEKIRSQHYDLVLNGNEIGGGSIRIHNAEVQRYVLENILKEDTSELQHLLEALSYGCPPHGGIALGLDRFLAIICQTESIRDVIAFPKSIEGKDLMSKAPAPVSTADLADYHIKVTDS